MVDLLLVVKRLTTTSPIVAVQLHRGAVAGGGA